MIQHAERNARDAAAQNPRRGRKLIRRSASCVAIFIGFLIAVGLSTESAAQAACPSPGNTDRFVDCGDGTVIDRLMELVWLLDPLCFGREHWAAASASAAGLADGQCDLTDGSLPGDWRLQTQDEWQSILDQVAWNGCSAPPFFPDTEGLGCCATSTCPFPELTMVEGADVQLKFFSSTMHPDNDVRVFVAKLLDGTGKFDNKEVSMHFPWPVRELPEPGVAVMQLASLASLALLATRRRK
jgi:hypothetical protein